MTVIDTQTFWSVDDIPLESFCRNVESLDGKFGTPPLRGDDAQVSYRNGKIWKQKQPDSRVVPLAMWVSGRGIAGEITAIGKERQFYKNMTDLQRLCYTYGRRQVKLTKRWKDLDGTVRSASAMAEVTEAMAPKVELGGIAARMVLNFNLADPYFYGTPDTQGVFQGVPTVLNVLGDVPTIRVSIQFNGQLANGKLTNTTPDPDHWVQVGSAIAAGDSVTIDTENFLATRTSDGANLVSAITRSGGREWMELVPGANTLTLTASSGTGTATVTWTPVYL